MLTVTREQPQQADTERGDVGPCVVGVEHVDEKAVMEDEGLRAALIR
jgi:hypothetical protein